MPQTSAAPDTRRIVPLLAAAIFINYFDRGSLAIASPLMQSELGLSKSQLGILFSAFFWSYAPLQPLAGWVAQRFDVRFVLGGGLAIWAGATALTGVAASFATLLALRVLLGVGESVAYPCSAKFLGQWVPPERRGVANALIAAGQSLGPTCGTLTGGLIMVRLGWRPMFLVFGLASLAWLIPWAAATRVAPGGAQTTPQPPLDYRVLLRTRALWGTSLGHFCGNYAYYFMLTWLPLYLVEKQGFSPQQMAIIGACIFALQALTALTAGSVCDRLIRGGAPPNTVLKTTMIIGLCGVALTMAACANAGHSLTVVLLFIAGAFVGLQSASMGPITQTLGGPRAAGQWMGVQNLCANMAGVLAPLLTGYLIRDANDYVGAFAVSAAVTLGGVFAYGWLIDRVQPVTWPPAVSENS